MPNVERTPPKTQNKNSSVSEKEDTSEDVDEDIVLHYPSGKLGAMTRKRNQILSLLSSPTEETLTEVGYLFEEFKQKIKNFSQACTLQLETEEIDLDIKADFVNWQKQHMQINSDFERRVDRWLKKGDEESDTLQNLVRPDDSISLAVSNTSNKSSNSLRVKLIQKKAQVAANREFIREKRKVEDQEKTTQLEFKLKQQQLQEDFDAKKSILKKKNEDLVLQRDEQENALIEKELDNFDGVDVFCNEPKARSVFQPNNTKLIASANNIEINEVILKQNETLSKQNEISLMLAKTNQLSLLPTPEPVTFDGIDITEYRSFILSFERTIALRCQEDVDKYYFLLKYTKGEPNELVKSCNYRDPSEAFYRAMKLLEQNYGNEYDIANLYLEKLENWKPIENEDATALNNLAIYLTRCSAMMYNMNALNQLNSLKEIRDIVKKLPWDLRKRFRNLAGAKMQAGEQITFQHLVDFVNKEAHLLKMPLLGDIRDDSRKAMNKFSSAISSLKNTNKKSFCASLSEYSEVKTGHRATCPCCKKCHELDICFFFLNKTMAQRQAFIKERKLCFGCLLPMTTNHSAKTCRNRIVCKKCKKKHPSSLHKNEDLTTNVIKSEDKKEDNESSNQQDSNSGAESVEAKSHHVKVGVRSKRLAYPSVLVEIRLQGKPKTIRTYMGMDPYSSDTFIDKELLEQMNVKSDPVNVILTTMEKTKSSSNYNITKNIEILSLDHSVRALLSDVYSKEEWPFQNDDSPVAEDAENYRELKNVPIKYANKKIGLLVGISRPDIVKPSAIVNTTRRGPYATKHMFGWAINGPITNHGLNKKVSCYHVQIEDSFERSLDQKIEKYFSQDFDDEEHGTGMSIDDIRWNKMVESSIVKLSNNHFQINLPFKDHDVTLPCNYDQAHYRLERLRSKFAQDLDYFNEYKNFMKSMRESGFFEIVPTDEIQAKVGKVWYLTHFAVRHKQKKKIRVVFDCSLKYQNISLNDMLLQGPDLINNLVGILLRFRQKRIAFSADITSMFYQVRVPTEDSDFLRFLWFADDDLSQDPVQFRLCVHVFGAKSSPSCANFALRRIASIATEDVSSEVKECILKAFYVDDIMKSSESEEIAIKLIQGIVTLLQENGFNLTGFVSNSRLVLNSLPSEKLSKDLKNIDLVNEELPYERALGVVWNTQDDTFGFRINIVDQPCTKRGILSTIFSIYDPLFVASPAIIKGRTIFQQACSMGLKWDEPLDHNLTLHWKKWISELHLLTTYEIPRCYNTIQSEPCNIQLHIFCDGSEVAYGAVAYLRFEDLSGRTNSLIVMAKVRLTPLNRGALKTVPRIELNAAKVAVCLQQKISTELELNINSVTFWSDSTVVLGYIKNDSERFQRFVANRIAFIRSKTTVDQWRFVPGQYNPADLLSRGSKSIAHFLQCNEWKFGPEFLQKDESQWPVLDVARQIPENDSEIKKYAFATLVSPNAVLQLLESCSNWFKLRSRVAYWLRLKDGLSTKIWNVDYLSVAELQKAELAIWQYLQQIEFKNTINDLKVGKLKKKDILVKLNPFIDKDGILRAQGRLKYASVPYNVKYPIILPKQPLAVRIYIENIHRNLGHLGRETVLAQLKQRVYIVGATRLVKDILRKCISCRKLHARPSEQIMADLPKDRLTGELPAFSSTGVDYFGPIFVSRGRGRAQEKRYGVLFTCMASRAMHIEIAHSLNSDSFINALRRFVSRRGSIQILRSDNGTNFVAGNKELKEAIKEWNEKQIDNWCKAKNIDWKFNPPAASHFGGVWEREVKTIKKVLGGLMSESSNKLLMTDELLSTLMCEVEDILNNRPLTAVSADINDLEALTPNHLLRLHFGVTFPPGLFNQKDLCLRKRWRQIQHLAEVFWTRWRREYIPLLMERQKWTLSRRSHQEGDLVLIVDQLLPRNLWCVGRIVNVTRDVLGHVRSARVKVSRYKTGHDFRIGISYLDRPITKLILLRSVQEL